MSMEIKKFILEIRWKVKCSEMGCRDDANKNMRQAMRIFKDLYSKLDQDLIEEFCKILAQYVEGLIETRISDLSDDDIEIMRLINNEYNSFLPDEYSEQISEKLYFLLDDLLLSLEDSLSNSAHK